MLQRNRASRIIVASLVIFMLALSACAGPVTPAAEPSLQAEAPPASPAEPSPAAVPSVSSAAASPAEPSPAAPQPAPAASAGPSIGAQPAPSAAPASTAIQLFWPEPLPDGAALAVYGNSRTSQIVDLAGGKRHDPATSAPNTIGVRLAWTSTGELLSAIGTADAQAVELRLYKPAGSQARVVATLDSLPDYVAITQ